MTAPERSTRRTVEFAHGFHLNEEDMPPGRYEVETEEELIPGLSFTAYRRVRTTLTSTATQHGIALQKQVQTIEPDALEEALMKDRARGSSTAEGPVVQAAEARSEMAAGISQSPSASTRGPRHAVGQFQKNNLISASPVLVPLLIIAGLTFITWYRPAPQGPPLDKSPGVSVTTPAAR